MPDVVEGKEANEKPSARPSTAATKKMQRSIKIVRTALLHVSGDQFLDSTAMLYLSFPHPPKEETAVLIQNGV
jgi:hypothetical protein